MADINVDLLDHMGSDLTVVNAARVSFHKESKWELIPYTPSANSEGWMDAETMKADKEAHGAKVGRPVQPVARPLDKLPFLSERDAKLIRYLARHGHWTPFGHCFAQFRIKAPIFVARQLQKHTVGLCWNEVSRRYVDDEPEFYEPAVWRKRAANAKQGSSDEVVETGFIMEMYHDRMKRTYQVLLELGVAPEQARMVLPQSMMTEWWWSGSLAAFARVCKLRLDPHAQRETAEVAQGIAGHLERTFPVSFQALMET